VPTEEFSPGGIILQHNLRERQPNRGHVLAVGPEVQETKVGDFVIFGLLSDQTEYEINGEPVVIMSEDVVLASRPA
jgi:co-chaperonin GroES (HSP10)